MDVSGGQLKTLAKDAVDAKTKDKEKEEEEAEEKKIYDTINQVESMTTDFTKNEFFKEKLVEKEKALKSKKDLEDLDKMIQKEVEKEKCIQTFIDREKRRAERKNKQKQAEQEMTEIKDQVEHQVKEIKHVFRNKMVALDVETERIKMEKMKKLTNMKIKITNLLIDQEFKGNLSNCKQDKEENKIA